MNKSVLFITSIVFLTNPIVLAGLHLTDGLAYEIDSIAYQDEYIYLDDNDDAIDSKTRVNLISDITIGLLHAYNNSTFTMSDGTVSYGISAKNYSTIDISGGTSVFPLWPHDNSTVSISGGYVERLSIHDNSTVDISGGHIGGQISSWDSCNVNISGGTFDRYVAAHDNSTVTISGGDIDSIFATHNGTIYLLGNDFEVFAPGVREDPSYGDRLSDYGMAGHITGRTMDNSPFDYAFNISGSGADIILIPEPTTVMMLWIGACFLKRKKELR